MGAENGAFDIARGVKVLATSLSIYDGVHLNAVDRQQAVRTGELEGETHTVHDRVHANQQWVQDREVLERPPLCVKDLFFGSVAIGDYDSAMMADQRPAPQCVFPNQNHRQFNALERRAVLAGYICLYMVAHQFIFCVFFGGALEIICRSSTLIDKQRRTCVWCVSNRYWLLAVKAVHTAAKAAFSRQSNQHT